MENLPRALVICAIVLGGALMVRGLYPADRFTLVAAQGGAYRIDRLTGAVAFCDALLCRQLPQAAFVPGAARPAAPKSPPVDGAGT